MVGISIRRRGMLNWLPRIERIFRKVDAHAPGDIVEDDRNESLAGFQREPNLGEFELGVEATDIGGF